MPLKLEIVPQKAVVVRRDKVTVAASWFGPLVQRPYIHPFLGPDDREVTSTFHADDPVGHSHHRSIWIAHHDVSGVNFWEEGPSSGRIEQVAATVLAAEGDQVAVRLECEWRTPAGKVLLNEKRTLAFIDLPRGELALEIDTTLLPVPQEKDGAITLADTPFGLLGIRVPRTVRVAEGLGGQIMNSQEAEDEKGCFWQHADWCDYSGPVPLPSDPKQRKPGDPLPWATVGIACFDHPDNSPGDTLWHVRDDGWMGPCISKGEPRKLTAGQSLRVRYRLEAHGGRPADARIGERYRLWREHSTSKE